MVSPESLLTPRFRFLSHILFNSFEPSLHPQKSLHSPDSLDSLHSSSSRPPILTPQSAFLSIVSQPQSLLYSLTAHVSLLVPNSDKTILLVLFHSRQSQAALLFESPKVPGGTLSNPFILSDPWLRALVWLLQIAAWS